MAGKPFYIEELRLAGALDIGRPVHTSTLKNPVHRLFDSWDKIDDNTKNVLLPSMQLASNLIYVGMPYISSFLPSREKTFWIKGGGDPRPSQIPLNQKPTQNDIDDATADLNSKVAKDLKWCLNDTMQPRWGHLGQTRLADTVEPWEILEFDTVLNSDMRLRFRGKKRRPLIIGVMREFATAITASDPRSEQRLKATFMAAITMVHEVGHAIFHNEFRSYNPIKEPYVGDSCEAELGFSFVSWIFGGFHPLIIPGDVEFKDTLFWDQQETLSLGERPLYRTRYSIPISYLERVMSQQFWNGYGNPSQLAFSNRARKGLRPKLDGQGGHVATSTSPNWVYSHLLQRPLWKEQNHYRMPGFQERNMIKGLTREEIEREREQTKEKREYAYLGKEERHNRYRYLRIINGMDVPDEDDFQFWGKSPLKASKTTSAKPPEPKATIIKPPVLKPTILKPPEPKTTIPTQPKPTIAKPLVPIPAIAKPVETKPAIAKLPEPKLTITKLLEPKSAITKLPEPKPTIAKSPEPLKQNLSRNDSKSDSENNSLKRPNSEPTNTSNPLKRPRLEDVEIEEAVYDDTTMKESQTKTRTKTNERKRKAPQDFELTSQYSLIARKSAGIANRVLDIEDLIYEPGPRSQKRRMLGTHIMEEIADFEAIMGITKELGRKPGAANSHLQTPASHMQDIYEQIIIEDNSEE